MTPAEAISEVLRAVAEMAKPGVNILSLERRAETTMQILGAASANKGYAPPWAKSPFPSVICLGVNDVIAHAVPQEYTLLEGDLLHVDCGLIVDGMCGDAGMTLPIGTISNRDERLLRFAKAALYEGIRHVRPGAKATEIGEAIEGYARRHGYVVNKRFLGHGIGRQMHEEPTIPHFYVPPEQVKVGKHKWEQRERENIPVLREGQVICLEPMLTYKDAFGEPDMDGWTFRTRDGKKSAFFEHMVRVGVGGCEILTNHIKEVNEDG